MHETLVTRAGSPLPQARGLSRSLKGPNPPLKSSPGLALDPEEALRVPAADVSLLLEGRNSSSLLSRCLGLSRHDKLEIALIGPGQAGRQRAGLGIEFHLCTNITQQVSYSLSCTDVPELPCCCAAYVHLLAGREGSNCVDLSEGKSIAVDVRNGGNNCSML